MVLLARSLVGLALVARLVRKARALALDEFQAGFSDSALRDGRGSSIRVLVSKRLATPITTGWRRPSIILPESAADWSDERRRVVLVHELAHISRGDYAAQLVAAVALSVLWFHPLAWLAVARLRAEAEHAADDFVLSSGTTSVAYASHLLALAQSAAPLRLSAAVAVGVVRSSRVERRFRAILDAGRARRNLGARAIAAAAMSAAVLLSPLGGVRTVARAMQAPTRPSRPVSAPPAPEPRSSVGAPAAAPQPPEPKWAEHRDIDSTIERTIDAASGATLRISLETGGGVVLHGSASPRIRMRVGLGGDDWRDVQLDLSRDGRDARLISKFRTGGTHGTALWFEIWVPRETNVDLSSAGGSLDVDRIDGNLTGHTGGGTLTIRRARGEARVSTGGGDIYVSDSHLSGRVTTGWGRVSIENTTGGLRGETNGSYPNYNAQTDRTNEPRGTPPSWPIETSRGSDASITNTNGGCVSVSVGDYFSVTQPRFEEGTPIRATGPISISKAGGNIDIFVAPAGATVSTGGGRIVIDSSDKSVVASTGGGDIELRATSGDAVASTGAGDVSIRVVGAGSGTHNINVCDGHGRVTLELPKNIDATFELETAYTDNAPNRTKIESDFDLSQSETHEWDDRFGTPRKFVRAAGKLGAGGSLIRVSTVNGDIVVRRR
jgi:hypothetical protein